MINYPPTCSMYTRNFRDFGPHLGWLEPVKPLKSLGTILLHNSIVPCACRRSGDGRTPSGRHGGAVGHTGLQVLHTLIFDFLNYASGRLDPSYAAIARKANVCERAVATALKRLRELGILNWVRRCAQSWQGRALRTRAGDERLCRAAGDAVARLNTPSRAASAWHLGQSSARG
jgi:hypothetical protein